MKTTAAAVTAEGKHKPAEENSRSAEAQLGSRRLIRERRTIAAMLQCYCGKHHHLGAALCPECQTLLDYATLRLIRCRFGTEKPTCANCPVHCYVPKRREQVREVMRYAGPRMLLRHPLLSFWHFVDGRRKTPALGSEAQP